MNKALKLVLIASIIICCEVNIINGQNYEDKYNLNFKSVDNVFRGWIFDPNSSAIRLTTDTTVRNSPMRFAQIHRWGFRERFKLGLTSSKKILLPKLSDLPLKVKIVYRGENLKTGQLFVYSLNQGMQIINTDSICLKNDDVMRVDSVQIPAKDLKFLFFKLQAIGKDSTYTKSVVMPIETTIPEELSIGEILVQSGNTKINELQFRDIPPLKLDKSQILPLSLDSIQTKKQLSHISKRITALGETVHGSSKISRATNEFIKSSVLNNHTNLILEECPLLMSLFSTGIFMAAILLRRIKLENSQNEWLEKKKRQWNC